MSLAVESSPAVSTPATGPRKRRVMLFVVYLLGVAIIAGLVVDGYSYYSTPYVDRPHHSDYRQLRPAGGRGLTYGIVGSSMMLLMLVYTLRKRTAVFGRRTPLRPFLDFHIVMGVFGPMFILLHTSFRVQGLVAVAFWSMVAVALSGYLGRYLYQQIPRNAQDQELNLQEIEKLLETGGAELSMRGRLEPEIIAQVNQLVGRVFGVDKAAESGSLWSIIMADLRRPFLRPGVRRRLRRLTRLPRREADRLMDLASRRALLRRRLTVLGKAQRLVHYWHVIHKPFAIIMYVIMFVHIGVAIWTGYGWF